MTAAIRGPHRAAPLATGEVRFEQTPAGVTVSVGPPTLHELAAGLRVRILCVLLSSLLLAAVAGAIMRWRYSEAITGVSLAALGACWLASAAALAAGVRRQYVSTVITISAEELTIRASRLPAAGAGIRRHEIDRIGVARLPFPFLSPDAASLWITRLSDEPIGLFRGLDKSRLQRVAIHLRHALGV